MITIILPNTTHQRQRQCHSNLLLAQPLGRRHDESIKNRIFQAMERVEMGWETGMRRYCLPSNKSKMQHRM